MKIALIGYGKMGKTLENIAESRNHEVTHRVETTDELLQLSTANTDVAIEFTQPEAAFENLKSCIEKGIPVISGTTGWLEHYQEIAQLTKSNNATFLHSSNFSIGVNLFFELNEWLAAKMSKLNFEASMEEIHHMEKKDSPSGTAIKLAEGIIQNSTFEDWTNEESTDHKKLGIISKRIPNVPGTHTVSYESNLESIEIKHEAKDRSVFAEGAVMVAEWIQDKKGVFTMSDFLNQQ